MKDLYFILPCTPTPQQRARHCASGIAYKSKTQKANERTLEAFLMPHRPAEPLRGPLELSFTAYFPIPKSWPKKRREKAMCGGVWHTARPDLDNLQKQLKDALTRMGFWGDDSQVASYGPTKKLYGPGAHGQWRVRIRELESDND